MKAFLKYLLMITVMLTIASCAALKKDSGTEGTEAVDQTNLDEEEKKMLQEKQKEIGGSYSQLRKLFQARRYRELQDEAAKILSRNEFDLRALAVLGLMHMEKGELGAARIFFEKALEKHPDESGLYNNIGVIQLQEGSLESAIPTFEKAYEVERSNPTVQANLGSIFVKYMDYVEAEPLVEEAYSRLSDNVIVANNYAIVLRTQGMYEEAKKVYEKALDKDARNIPTNLNYAILLVEYMKKYQEAQRVVNKLEFLNPTDKYVLAKIKDLQRKVAAAR